ncbi:MAG: alpha/beta fold hydrolase [Pseudomonadota bacterium]
MGTLSKRLWVLLAPMLLAACAAGTSGKAFDPVTADVPEIDPQYPPQNFEVSFSSAGNRLPGYLMVANGRGPHPTIVLLHGYPGNEKNLDLGQSLRRAGFNVLFMHYRGAWGAQGRFSIASLHRDVAAALSWLRGEGRQYRVDGLRYSLVGHSMGGYAALRAGASDARLDCVVGLAAANLGEYADRPPEAIEGFMAYTDGLFMLDGFDGATAVRELQANQREFDLRNAAAGLAGKSVLLITGQQDSVVPPDVQRRLATAYQEFSRLNLTALEMPGDHAFAGQRILLQRTVVAWMAQNCR